MSTGSLAGLLAVLLVSAFGQDQQHWKVMKEQSEMTDETITGIATAAEGSSEDDGAALGVACAKKVEVLVSTSGLDYLPSSRPWPAGEGVFSPWYGHRITDVRVRLDSDKPTRRTWALLNPKVIVASQSGGKGLVKELMRASRFRVEYTTIAGETRVLTFDVTGLQQAMQSLPGCKLD
jgi:hypothetical protein